MTATCTRVVTATQPFLDPSELCAAWKEISASEPERPPLASITRRLPGDVCGQCNGTGYKIEEVKGVKVSRKCECVPEAVSGFYPLAATDL